MNVIRRWAFVPLILLTAAPTSAMTPTVPSKPIDATWVNDYCDDNLPDICRGFILGVIQANQPTQPYHIPSLYCDEATVQAIVGRIGVWRKEGRARKMHLDAASYVLNAARDVCRKP